MTFGSDRKATCLAGHVLCSGSFCLFGKTLGAEEHTYVSETVKPAL